jgi:hypothetical protein
MLGRERHRHERQRWHAHDGGQARLLVEHRDEGATRGNGQREGTPYANVEPGECADLTFRDADPLDDRVPRAEVDQGGEPRECGDHRHKPVVLGHQQTRQKQEGGDLDQGVDDAGDDRNGSAAERLTTKAILPLMIIEIRVH